MKRFGFLIALILVLTLTIAPVKAAYFNGDENPSVSSEVKEDAFIAGNTVSITAPIAGEIFAVGNSVSITKTSARSIFAAGSNVTIDQGAGYNAYMAGNNLTLAGEFGHDVYAAGANIIVKEGTVIKGDLRAAGSNVTINGTVQGNVELNAEKINFAGGTIGGNLTYYSDQDATGLDKVKVGGKTEKHPSDQRNLNAQQVGAFVGAAIVASWFSKLLATLLLGALLIWLVPKKVTAITEIINTEWTRATTLGIVAVVVVPFIALLLFFTLIGWKIGLALLFAYSAWLMIAPVYGVIIAGRWILNKLGDATPNIWAVLLVGAVVVSLVGIIPSVGALILIHIALFVALTLPALGATLMWMRKQLD